MAEILPFILMRFVEKPARELAEEYLRSGWNAGIFLLKASAMVSLFKHHAPDILEACRRALDEATTDLGFLRLGDAYADAPAISLDCAIAEKADNIRCVPLTCFRAPRKFLEAMPSPSCSHHRRRHSNDRIAKSMCAYLFNLPTTRAKAFWGVCPR